MGLDPKTLEQIQGISSLVVKHGIPTVVALVNAMGSNPNPTVEDIEALGENVLKDPESFFKDKPEGGGA
ncbi:hypothetical protein LCGC14_1231250 [marine sediment metagenome]|uniref:Uncharacterized protein n=1 Tax=marine sediment metagenome TaxID=412755 RepID=A0A0F9PCS4_9ZZZZ